MRLSIKMLVAAWLGFLSLAQAQVTSIQHVVLIFKENRSFDHMFGTMPGVNGATQGKLRSGRTIALSHAPDRSGNYAHYWDSVLQAIDGGKMDGFDTTSGCGQPMYLCYSQYNEKDIPNYFAYARNYLIADNFFSSMTGPSFPNHQYTIASQANGGISNPTRKGTEYSLNWGCDSPSGSFVVSYDPSTNRFSRISPCQDYKTGAREDLPGLRRHAAPICSPEPGRKTVDGTASSGPPNHLSADDGTWPVCADCPLHARSVEVRDAAGVELASIAGESGGSPQTTSAVQR
jgi:phosphoesterase family protein